MDTGKQSGKQRAAIKIGCEVEIIQKNHQRKG